MSAVKAGSPALRKVMRRLPGFSLEGRGVNAHLTLLDPEGCPVRLRDGRKLTIISSPRDDERAARELVRVLRSLGIEVR